MLVNARRSAGWAGLIMLIVVVVIIGLLGSTLLKQYFSSPSATVTKSPRGPGAATTSAHQPLESAGSPAPAAAIERAHNLGSTMQKQAEEQHKRIDALETK